MQFLNLIFSPRSRSCVGCWSQTSRARWPTCTAGVPSSCAPQGPGGFLRRRRRSSSAHKVRSSCRKQDQWACWSFLAVSILCCKRCSKHKPPRVTGIFSTTHKQLSHNPAGKPKAPVGFPDWCVYEQKAVASSPEEAKKERTETEK